MKTILTPFSIKDMTLKNRVVMAPMCMYSARQDGLATDFHHTHYTTRAVGNVGLLLVEATAVSPEGRISDQDLGIWNDEQRDRLKPIVAAVQSYGSKIGLQLAHAGRKSASQTVPHYSVTGQTFSPDYITPKKMSPDDYQRIARDFQAGARRALEAGFDLIEIHAAHGYLLSESLSPLPRPDMELAQRVELLNQVIVAVQTVWPEEKPLQVRLSASDWHDEGLSRSDLVQLVRHLKSLGVDSINVSSGGVTPLKPPTFPGYQIPLAEFIKQSCDIATIGGGLIETIDMATEIIQNGRTDLIYLGRELLRNPYFVHQLGRRYEIADAVPTAYRRA